MIFHVDACGQHGIGHLRGGTAPVRTKYDDSSSLTSNITAKPRLSESRVGADLSGINHILRHATGGVPRRQIDTPSPSPDTGRRQSTGSPAGVDAFGPSFVVGLTPRAASPASAAPAFKPVSPPPSPNAQPGLAMGALRGSTSLSHQAAAHSSAHHLQLPMGGGGGGGGGSGSSVAPTSLPPSHPQVAVIDLGMELLSNVSKAGHGSLPSPVMVGRAYDGGSKPAGPAGFRSPRKSATLANAGVSHGALVGASGTAASWSDSRPSSASGSGSGLASVAAAVAAAAAASVAHTVATTTSNTTVTSVTPRRPSDGKVAVGSTASSATRPKRPSMSSAPQNRPRQPMAMSLQMQQHLQQQQQQQQHTAAVAAAVAAAAAVGKSGARAHHGSVVSEPVGVGIVSPRGVAPSSHQRRHRHSHVAVETHSMLSDGGTQVCTPLASTVPHGERCLLERSTDLCFPRTGVALALHWRCT